MFIEISRRHTPFPGGCLQGERFGGGENDLLDQLPDFRFFRTGRRRVFQPFQCIAAVQNVQLHGQIRYHILGAEPGPALFLYRRVHQTFHHCLFVELPFQRFRQVQFLGLNPLFLIIHIIIGTDVPVFLLFHCLRLPLAQGIYLYYSGNSPRGISPRGK